MRKTGISLIYYKRRQVIIKELNSHPVRASLDLNWMDRLETAGIAYKHPSPCGLSRFFLSLRPAGAPPLKISIFPNRQTPEIVLIYMLAIHGGDSNLRG